MMKKLKLWSKSESKEKRSTKPKKGIRFLRFFLFYRNISIGVKLTVGFAFVSLILVFLGYTSINNIQSIQRSYSNIYQSSIMPLSYIGRAAVYLQDARVSLRNALIDEDKSKMSSYIQDLEGSYAKVNTEMSTYSAVISSEEEKTAYEAFSKELSNMQGITMQITSLIRSGSYDQAKQVLLNSSSVILDSAYDKLITISLSNAKRISDTNQSQINTITNTLIATAVTGFVLAIAIGLMLSISISRRVKKLVLAANRLAQGDVAVDVKSNSKDEIGKLMISFSRMIETIRGQAQAVEKLAEGNLDIDVNPVSESDLLGNKLKEMVGRNNEALLSINSAAEQVAAGSKQISESSVMLSQGATEQASSIEEITASMEQIAAQTGQSAGSAKEANSLALLAKEDAITGNVQMQDMLVSMEEINDSSASISKIIKVIDDIAFQTNILALNAAVEAARAGQNGRGFAVVADEVRNLASKSAQAAKETAELIETSMKKTENGTKIAQKTADSLQKIVDGVTRAAELVGGIAGACDEQATAIVQINKAIMQVSDVIQTNSSTAEESAAASEELSSQSEALKGMTSSFKLRKKQVHRTIDDLSPEMLKLFEELMEQRDEAETKEKPGSDKQVQIDLDDAVLSKY